MKIELLKEDESFGGQVQTYRHNSPVNNCDMQFSIYLPPLKNNNKAPVLTWLSGLTCNEDTFMIKAGAQRMASELGLVIVAPDTSPRGDDIPDDEQVKVVNPYDLTSLNVKNDDDFQKRTKSFLGLSFDF